MKKRINKFKPLIVIIIFVLICIILHLNLLFPWQSLNRENRNAMRSYIDKNYPNAKIIEKDYNMPDFWATPKDDGFKVRWNGAEFWIRAGYGKISFDNYAEKQRFTDISELVYYGFCVPYSALGLSNQSAYEMRPLVTCKDGKDSTVTDFYNHNGNLMFEVYISQNTNDVSEISWLWDFCYYMCHKFSLHIGREDYKFRVTVTLASGVKVRHLFRYGEYFGGIDEFPRIFI